MGRTWPNLDAETVTEPGYYWNERLKKLARLSAGEKLPRHVGAWEFVAREGEASSSEVSRRIFDRYPGMSVNEFTYTTTSPLNRRLPMGDTPPKRLWMFAAGLALGAVAVGIALERYYARKHALPPKVYIERRPFDRRAARRDLLLEFVRHGPSHYATLS